jgi:hypothetical protein
MRCALVCFSERTRMEARTMKRLLVLSGILPLLMATTLPAKAAIHEMVSAFCSGGGVGAIAGSGFLDPPGVTNPALNSFQQPSVSSGVVVGPVIGSSPAAKYPAGTPVAGLVVSDSNHPSAQHCPGAQGLP